MQARLSGSRCFQYPTCGIQVVSRPAFRDETPGAFRDPGGSGGISSRAFVLIFFESHFVGAGCFLAVLGVG